MDLIKITEVTNQLDISSRSLRYYEEMGLIRSVRLEFEKYRYYNMENVERLKQIMILRKMQIPIKDIIRIYESEDMSVVVDTFVQRINSIDEEVNALTKLKRITNEFLQIMTTNGIKKISALPLLYDEMDKQIDMIEEHQSVTYEELSTISKKTEKALDIRIVDLPSMRVLSSYIKSDNNQKSDTDAWHKWMEDNQLAYKKLGSHDHFEYFDTVTNDLVCFRKIQEDFHNKSPFIDFIFEGNLFAVLGTYYGDDMGKAYDDLKYYIEHMLDGYMLDYPYINQSKIDCLGEEVLSPYVDRGRYDIYMPIKKRSFLDNQFSTPEIINNITLKELKKENPLIQTIRMDLYDMTPVDCNVYKEDEFSFTGYVYNSGIITKKCYQLPLRLDLSVKLNGANLYLDYGMGDGQNASLILRYRDWHNNSDSLDLYIHDPVVRTEYHHRMNTEIKEDEFTDITWMIGERYFSILINNEVIYCATNYPYMNFDFNVLEHQPIKIGSNNGKNAIIMKDFYISRLQYSKKIEIRRGELAIMQKQSNNIIPEIHNLVTWHYGQNYPFNGCMQFIMEKAGREDLADYWLFAGLSGDSFSFVYGRNQLYNDCVSVACGGPDFIRDVFDAIGYEHTYITKDQINGNKELYIGIVINYIDKGLPVLVRFAGNANGNYQVICGYEDNGKVLLFLDGDQTEPSKLDTTTSIKDDWIFIGNKKKEITLAELYRNTVLRIPHWLTMAENENKVFFGAEGYRNWADDIEHGRYDELTGETFDQWRDYTVYVCNLATNSGGSQRFLEKAYELNPDLFFIPNIIEVFKHTGDQSSEDLWKHLESIGGGFNITLEVLQDIEKRNMIANHIRLFADSMDRICLLYEERLS